MFCHLDPLYQSIKLRQKVISHTRFGSLSFFLFFFSFCSPAPQKNQTGLKSYLHYKSEGKVNTSVLYMVSSFSVMLTGVQSQNKLAIIH